MKKSQYVITKKNKINVINSNELAKNSTPEELEMDMRARAAVRAAINKAKICGLPVARYDSKHKKAYIELANGEKYYE